MIREKLLVNSHRLVVTSKPSRDEGPRRDQEEEARLASHKETLDDAGLDVLIEETKALKEMQETPDPPDSLSCVPRLELSDIPKETLKIPEEVGSLGQATVLRHPLLTSGVAYVDVAFDLGAVPADLLPLLPLFCRGLREMGTKKSDFVQLQQRADLSTGGISASPLISAKRGSDDPVAYLVMRGKAMQSKADSLFDLMAEMSTEVTWNNKERFLQLAREAQAGVRTQLLSSGHVIAAGRLGRQTTVAGWVSEELSGLAQFQYLGKILKRAEEDWSSVEAQLQDLQSSAKWPKLSDLVFAIVVTAVGRCCNCCNCCNYYDLSR